MAIKEIIFDFDGTIADSFDLSVEILNEISDEFSFKKFTQKEIEILKDFGFREAIKGVEIPMIKLPAIISETQKKQTERIDSVKPFKEVLEVIKELEKRDYHLGILTSNAKKNVERFFDKNKVKGIEYIYSGNNLFGKDKLIKKILKKRGLKKEEVIYIGDEVRDVESCKKIGVKIIGVTWGYNSRKGMEKSNPDYLIDKAKEILKILN